MTTPRSQQEYYNIGKNEIQTTLPELTDFNDGSINDIILGTASVLAQEITRLVLDRFKKTYLNSSEGDDLEYLATDHFGDTFSRPAAQKAVGIVKFSRPDALAGDCVIGTSVIVKTAADANGESQRFQVTSEVTLAGTEINASVEAISAGVAGNVEIDECSTIETALTDSSIIVTNEDAFSGGSEEEDDAEYRETIRRLIQELKGATLDAVRAAALNVSGVEQATAKEFIQTVKEWNGAATVGEAFNIPHVMLYVADANGVANDALIALVVLAVEAVRACGVYIQVLSAIAQNLNWTASITLDPSGPNYATLQSDTTMIVNSMTEYIEDLPIGTTFSRALADAAMLAIWGPAGTGDLTAFTTTSPSGDVDPADNEKFIPNTIETA